MAGIAAFLCFIIIIVLINVLTTSVYQINKDSYQFLLGNELPLSFYNRAGYALLLDTIAWFGLGKLTIALVINNLALLLIAWLIFVLARKNNWRWSSAVILGVVTLTNPIALFLLGSVNNDLLATAILLLLLYRVLIRKDYSVGEIALFTGMGLLRIEYCLVLLPLYSFKQELGLSKMKFKDVFRSCIAVLIGNVLVLSPYFSQTWFSQQLGIFKKLGWDFLSLALLMMFFFLVLFYFRQYLLRILILLVSVMLIVLLFSPSALAQFVILVAIFLPLLVAITVNSRSLFMDKSGYIPDYQLYVFRFMTAFGLLLFMFYKTLYFQHLYVLAPILLLVLIYSFHQHKLAARFRVWNASLILLILWSCMSYSIWFARYDIDLAQLTAIQVNSKIETLGLGEEDSVTVAGPYPEAYKYWLQVNTEVGRNYDYIIVVSFEPEETGSSFPIITAERYVPLEVSEYKLDLNYQIYEEGVGYNPTKLYLYVYKKV